MFGDIPFQTTRAYHKKKEKKKKEKKKEKKKGNAVQYKNKQPFIQGTKDTQKKRRSKNPKTQNVFPDQNSYSLRLQTLLCSFKHTDRP